MVVTATRGSKAVDKIPGAVSVISRGEIDNQTLISEDPSQLLAAQVPGYGPARQKLSNFGEGLRGRNALLLLDGIPQTNPLRFGGREGYFADPMVIERIEVVSGASAAQGMGATGGIINTITRRPTQPGTRHTVEAKYITQGHADTQGWKTGYMLEHKGGGPDGFDALAYLGARSQGVGIDGDGRTLATESLHQAADAFLKIGHNFGPQRVQLMLTASTAPASTTGSMCQATGPPACPRVRSAARWPGTRRATTCARPASNGRMPIWPAATPARSSSSRISRRVTAAASSVPSRTPASRRPAR